MAPDSTDNSERGRGRRRRRRDRPRLRLARGPAAGLDVDRDRARPARRRRLRRRRRDARPGRRGDLGRGAPAASSRSPRTAPGPRSPPSSPRPPGATSACSSSARCTSRSTATRPPSCAAATSSWLAYGLEAEWLAPSACRELEPGLGSGGARRRPRPARVRRRSADAGRGARRARFERAGGRIEIAEVTERPVRGRRAWPGVRTADGARASRAARSCSPPAPGRRPSGCRASARPPVRPVKGQILTLAGRRRGRCASGSSSASASTSSRGPTGA